MMTISPQGSAAAPLADRVAGALLGTFAGDALGSAYALRPGGPGRARLERVMSGRPLRYTDDTQMALALAGHLVRHGEVVPAELAADFLADFDIERDYGLGMIELFLLWMQGADPEKSATAIFPEGSYGNGAAMRVAPLGAFLARRPEELAEQVYRASSFTHAHPVGIDAALAQARAVAIAVCTGAFGPGDLVTLSEEATDAVVASALGRAAELATRPALAQTAEVIEILGNDVTADRSVPTALYLAATSEDLLHGVARALEIGGDTDTIAAMAGAVLGARTGVSGFPPGLLDLLEDDGAGRTHALELAERLARRAGF